MRSRELIFQDVMGECGCGYVALFDVLPGVEPVLTKLTAEILRLPQSCRLHSETDRGAFAVREAPRALERAQEFVRRERATT